MDGQIQINKETKMDGQLEINEKTEIIEKEKTTEKSNPKEEQNKEKTLGLSEIKKTFRKEISSSETKFYRTSLRSGQKIEFAGSIVIIGNVNDGAEIIAEENIIVLGTLRGMAHAGARGNEKAIIAAQTISSNQLRIASKIKEMNKEEMEITHTYVYVNEEGKIELE